MAKASPRTKKKDLITPLTTAAPEARTVVYVHGIGNKPKSSVLKCQWDTSLFGVPLGDRTRMAYWVNREFYPTPAEETCAAGDLVSTQGDEVSAARMRAAVSLEGDLIEADIPRAP